MWLNLRTITVRQTAEALLDSAFFGTTSSIVLQKIKDIDVCVSNGFDIDEFVMDVARTMRGNWEPRAPNSQGDEVDLDDIPLDWSLVGRRVLTKAPGRRVPVMDFM